jgi:hypothetical protein
MRLAIVWRQSYIRCASPRHLVEVSNLLTMADTKENDQRDRRDSAYHEELTLPVVNGDYAITSEQEKDNSQDPGTKYTVKKLWEDTTNQQRLVWLSEPPAQEEHSSDEDSPQYAITLLHRDIEQTGKHRLDTIVLRGTRLRRFLEDTIPNASSHYDETEQGIALKAPFRPLFWHLSQIEKAARSTDKELRTVTGLLLGVLQDEFRDLLTKRKALIAAQEMNFAVLWTLYKPGITCYTKADDHVVAARVTSIHYSRDPMGKIYYRIKHNVLAWDGLYFGWDESYTDVFEFSGRKKILDLDIYPMEFHTVKSTRSELIARGKSFVRIAIQEPHLMNFSGEALDRESTPMWWQGEQKRKVSAVREIRDSS